MTDVHTIDHAYLEKKIEEQQENQTRNYIHLEKEYQLPAFCSFEQIQLMIGRMNTNFFVRHEKKFSGYFFQLAKR